MFQIYTLVRRFLLFACLLLSIPALVSAQGIRPRPTWWFGGAAGANINWYNGTAQLQNDTLLGPAPFHKGSGVGPYIALGIEYRPSKVWGGMLYVGYDDRRGSWDDIVFPCDDCPASLKTTLSYISIEPSLRIAPFAGRFHMFVGPRIGINMAKTFTYQVEGQPEIEDEWSDIRSTVVSGQIGMGYDISLSSQHDRTQVDLAPFVSFHPYFGQDPRSVENWAVSTLRVGLVLKVGRAAVAPKHEVEVYEREVEFTVQAPDAIVIDLRVRESFPLRNYVFFDGGSAEIPKRYVALSKGDAKNFEEEQLQEIQPSSMTGRSGRQMAVYYNILNIVGDRMTRSTGSKISLSGASEKGSEHGKERAEAVKKYLVDVFGIEGSRITTEGREKPKIPSEQPGGTKELDLLRMGDQRVDIESTSPEMMIQVGGGDHYMMKPVQIVADDPDPLNSHVIFDVVGAKELLTSWSLEIKDEQGKAQNYGPYTLERETIAGRTILGDQPSGDFKVVMVGQTKSGKVVRIERSFHLVRTPDSPKEAIRYSILFDFDKSQTVASYEKFLTEIVTPLISDSSTVVVRGYTDTIGEADYNLILSHERAMEARGILDTALTKSGKRHVKVQTFEFGEMPDKAPFENDSPEERFYNRTVILDIVPIR